MDKEFPRYNIVSIRLNEAELTVVNQLCDSENISASKACRRLMFGNTDEKPKEKICCGQPCKGSTEGPKGCSIDCINNKYF